MQYNYYISYKGDKEENMEVTGAPTSCLKRKLSNVNHYQAGTLVINI